MRKQDLTFQISDNGCRIYALYHGQNLGSVFFVKIGTDKIMISDAEIDPQYKNTNIEFYLTQQIITMAREQHRKVMSICPFITDIFKSHPEFDDVRLLNNGR